MFFCLVFASSTWLISLTTSYVTILVENWFHEGFDKPFNSLKLPLDSKILISLIPLISTTCSVSQEGGRWGGQPPAHLLWMARLGKWEPEASRRASGLGSWGSAWALCQSSWELWWGTFMQTPSWVQFILYLPYRAVHGYLFSVPLEHTSSCSIHWTLTACQPLGPGWQRTSLGKEPGLCSQRTLTLNPGSKTW